MSRPPWRFALPFGSVRIWRWSESPPADPSSSAEAAAAIRVLRWLDASDERPKLLEICQELGAAWASSSPARPAEQLLDLVAEALEQGRLSGEVEQERVVAIHSGRKDPQPVAPPPEPIPEFFDVQIVWDDSGKPLGIPLVVEPKGSAPVMRTTDPQGRVRIEPVNAGPCEVRCSFEGLRLEDCVTVVGSGEAARTEAERSAAPARDHLRPQAIVASSWYQVQDGDTLASLAAAKCDGIRWQALAKFNFGVDAPDQVNRHLRDDVGCTRKTPDGANYQFSAKDVPGQVALPRKWTTRLDSSRHHVLRVMPIVRPRVAVLRAADGAGAPPRLVAVKNALTEPAQAHLVKIKVVHNLGSATYAWSTASAKITLSNQTTDTVTVTAGAAASASPEDEVLKLTVTPAAGGPPIELVHNLGVVSVEFEEEASHPGGYDKYETLACKDQAGTASTVDPADKHDFVSIEKSTVGKVGVKFAGARKEDVFFQSEDDAVAKPKVASPAGPSPQVLEIDGGAKDKAETIINARLESATGPIVAKLGAVVLKKAAYEAELFRVQDGASAGTALTEAVTGADATTHNASCFAAGIATLTITGGGAVTDVAYDTGAGCTANGALDKEPGVVTAEETAIEAACISTKSRVIVVHDLRWSYCLGADAAAGASSITITNYGAGYLGYIGVGNDYTLEDSAGAETIRPTAVDTATGVVTLGTPLTRAFTRARKAALIWPLGGLSGDPAWVKEGEGVTVQKDVIAHELGHQLAGFLDICEVANLMYGVNDRTRLRLRHRALRKLYGAGDEKQWTSMNRP